MLKAISYHHGENYNHGIYKKGLLNIRLFSYNKMQTKKLQISIKTKHIISATAWKR